MFRLREKHTEIDFLQVAQSLPGNKRLSRKCRSPRCVATSDVFQSNAHPSNNGLKIVFALDENLAYVRVVAVKLFSISMPNSIYFNIMKTTVLLRIRF